MDLVSPFGGAKVTAAAEKAIQDGHTEVSLDKNSNTITFSGGKTEAQTYTVSNSDMDQLQSSFLQTNFKFFWNKCFERC